MMSKKRKEDENLDKLLGFDKNIEDAEIVDNNPITVANTSAIVKKTDDDIEDGAIDEDFEFARATIKSAIMDGSQAIAELVDVAHSSQDPRAYKVLSSSIKNITDASKTLLDMRKTKKDLKTKEQAVQQPTGDTIHQNNVVFNGSTAELLEYMRSKKKD